MHHPANQPQPRLWLIAGTGDGRDLAHDLLRQGWRLLVSVVSPEAALAYPALPQLVVRVGALGGEAGIRRVLDQASRGGDPFEAVVDATHPFAREVTAALARVWRQDAGGSALAGPLPPLLRLQRADASDLPVPRLRLLPDLEGLGDLPMRGCRLLLAIGVRQLRRAVALSPGALHHARLLPTPAAVQQGRAAGLAAERLACLRPGDPLEPRVLRALLQRWRIETILCRQSGGHTERLWRTLAGELDLQLLLLVRPAEPDGLAIGDRAALLRQLEDLPRPANPPHPQLLHPLA
jgi:precorrin-6A/cobalt-precorrin-6A reductase